MDFMINNFGMFFFNFAIQRDGQKNNIYLSFLSGNY